MAIRPDPGLVVKHLGASIVRKSDDSDRSLGQNVGIKFFDDRMVLIEIYASLLSVASSRSTNRSFPLVNTFE